MAEDCQTVDDTGSACDQGVRSNMEVSIKKEVHSPNPSQAELRHLQTEGSAACANAEFNDNTEPKSVKGEESDSSKDCEHSKEHLMQLAEILYKCTLCTSLPSILTSKESFLAHVKREHLNRGTSSRSCNQCDLKFDTDEDLRAHDENAHKTVTDSMDSDDSDSKDSLDSVKDRSSASDERRPISHPSVHLTSSPITVPKQEPSNMPRQEFPCNKYQVVKPSAPVVKVNELYKPENLTRIQQLTDQIVQSQTPGHQSNLLQPWSSMSSFTPEFGRYTKLVREGGNIVYFCQVCNWKCQVKAAFQAHCNGPHHANKVRLADQNNPHRKRSGSAASASPGRTSGLPSPSPSPPHHTSDSESQKSTSDGQSCAIKSETKDSLTVPAIEVPRPRSQCSTLPDMPFLQGLLAKTDEKKTEEGSNFIFQKRCDKEKTPEYRHPGLTVESFFEKRQREGSCGSPANNRKGTDANSTIKNKRKRPTPVSLRNQSGSRHGWSDSDTDDCATDSTFSDCDQPHPKKSKQEPQPVQRDDFHSRLMKRAFTGVSQLDKNVSDSQSSPFGEQHRLSQYIQNSLRNRLFANAYGAGLGVGLAPMYGWYGQPNPPFPSPMAMPEENGLKDNKFCDNPYEKSLRYGSKLFSGCLTPFDYSGKHQQLSETIASLPNVQSENSEKDNSSPKRDGYKIKSEPVDGEELQCSMCEFTCRDFHTYRHHFLAEHDAEGAENMLGEGPFNPMNEGWKVSKIRDCLPDLLVDCDKGNVSRDLLLQKVSLVLALPEVIHWGPACNKAVREVFQNSLAQRKGKYKKTYFFGVALLEQLQEQDDLSDSENITYQPLRDMSQDLEKILEHLPGLVYWTGDGESWVSRDDLLELLAEKIEEKDVQHWGVQCNRAMRMLFPEVQMKRKGKYKTLFFGVDFSKNLQKEGFTPSKRGRPRRLTDDDDDEDDDDDQSVAPVVQTDMEKTMLAWRAQMQHLKFFAQPRFQHHWRGDDGGYIGMFPHYPPSVESTEISKDYNFLAAEMRNKYMYGHPPFPFPGSLSVPGVIPRTLDQDVSCSAVIPRTLDQDVSCSGVNTLHNHSLSETLKEAPLEDSVGK